MKRWQETAEIFDRIAELRRRDRGASLALVVGISGSAYRRPGARFLIEEDGSTLGSVSGGCLEGDVREVGRRLVSTGSSRLLHYDTGGDDETVWGLGLGCDGEVDVFVHDVAGDGIDVVIDRVRELLRGDEPFAVATVLDGEGAGRLLVLGPGGVVVGSSGDSGLDGEIRDRASGLEGDRGFEILRLGDERVFIESFTPPPYVVVCGAGDDAMPLCAVAARLGLRVVMVDHRGAYVSEDRFPAAWRRVRARPEDDAGDEERAGTIPGGSGAYVVVKTHNLERDRAWVRRFLAADVPYVGLLGPKRRREEILEDVAAGDRSRVYGPVGLDLGAEGPEQVALSIVAEILAVFSGRLPRHLRERRSPIHPRPNEETGDSGRAGGSEVEAPGAGSRQGEEHGAPV